MLKNVSELSNKFMGKFSTSPRYIQAIQFDGSPECEENMHHITGGKVTVDNSNVDKPIMHIEIDNMALTLTLWSWLVCKVADKTKWTSHEDTKFNELYQRVGLGWKRYPDNTPERYGIFRVFGEVNVGTDHQTEQQFYAHWNGETFTDADGEDLTGINESVTHFLLDSSIDNPE